MHSLLTAIGLLFLPVSIPQSSDAAPPAVLTEDPEAGAKGRDAYLGRSIARTMHWTGAEWLMRETREDEEHCSKLLVNLGNLEGKTICDFGCGNGYYTLPIAELVGDAGRVLAVDLQQEMLTLLGLRTGEAGLKNVTPVKATLTDTGLAKETCDGILLVDVYHEISHPVTVLKGLRNALKPKGRLYLVEYRLEDESVPIKLKHKMSKAQMILEMSANGLRFAEEFDELPWQHVMAFERDPDFDAEKNQDLAAGKAVAAGLHRALLAGETLSLKGFYGPHLQLAAPSALLSETEKPGGVRLSKAQWYARLEQFRAKLPPEAWPEIIEGMQLKVVPTSDPNTIQLAPWLDAGAFTWVLTKNKNGQWFVTETSL